MDGKLKLLKAVAKVYHGITVAQFNEMFKGKSYDVIRRYLTLIKAEGEQFGRAE